MRYQLTEIREHLACPHCGAVTYIHEYKERVVHSGVYLGVPVYYGMRVIRYECSVCGAAFMADYDYLPFWRTITNETEDYIIWPLGCKTFSAIAEETGLSVQTISRRAAAFADEEQKVMLACRCKYLSMDEVYIGRDKKKEHVIY
ncbi:MAG: hypothetical protein LBB94_03640 [Clostridiales bacterium]|nr:hypothetical protein [Clostridiales bacterium]